MQKLFAICCASAAAHALTLRSAQTGADIGNIDTIEGSIGPFNPQEFLANMSDAQSEVCLARIDHLNSYSQLVDILNKVNAGSPDKPTELARSLCAMCSE